MQLHPFFITILNHFEQNLPFVVYKKPNESTIQVLFQEDDKLHKLDDFKARGFVFAPFDTSNTSFIIPFEATQHKTFNLLDVETVSKKSKDVLIPFSEEEKQNHINLVNHTISELKETKLSKVVLSREIKFELNEDFDGINYFRSLANTYPEAFSYCWFHPKVGLWIGATPETLWKSKGNTFKTMALAGTQAFEGTIDVKWNEKEINEQNIVANYVSENLTNAVKTLKQNATETVRAGQLLHLQTEFTGTIETSKTDLKNIIHKLHPTPAVCGFPKQMAKDFILKNENYNREFYTGFLGELNFIENRTRSGSVRNTENLAYRSVKSVTNLYVNLRCMKVDKSHAHIYVGGGITKDSVPEKEWEETQNKSKTLIRLL